jgi:hypothetical protein
VENSILIKLDYSEALFSIACWFSMLNQLTTADEPPYNWEHPILVDWMTSRGKTHHSELDIDELCILQMSLVKKFRTLLSERLEGESDAA